MVECMIKDGRKIASALALCDPRDKFDLKKGMDKSTHRAMHQMSGRKDRDHTLPINTVGAIITIECCGFTAPPMKSRLMTKAPLISRACKLEQKFLDI